MEVHEKIRVMREINQWSQEEMAEKLGMSTTGYAKIERGKSNINIEKLKQIAAIFNIDFVELISNNERSFFFSIGDHTNNNNYIGINEAIAQENQSLKRLLASKENEINALRETIELLKSHIQK